MAGVRGLILILLAGMMLLNGCSGTERPAPVGSSPANGATSVAVTTSAIRITANWHLYGKTVNIGTVLVVEHLGNSHLLPGTVTYDDNSQTITFTPSRRLAAGASYTVTLNGIQDIDGNSMPRTTYTFSTVINPPGRTVTYNTAGQITGHTERSYDAAGRLVSSIDYTGAGTDGTWLTGDDVASAYETRSYDARGNLVRVVTAKATPPAVSVAGPDGILFTADDLVVSCRVDTFDSGNRMTRSILYTGPGTDGVWFTADDTAAGYTTFSHGSAGQNRLLVYSSGPDAIPLTADDLITGRTDFSYNGAGQMSRSTDYGAGADGIWLTADDTVVSYANYFYDGYGNLTFRTAYGGPGVDGTWFTGDDVVAGYRTSPTDNFGDLLSSIEYAGPGFDNIWFTADDQLGTGIRVTKFYDAVGRVTTWNETGPGADGVSGTPDDHRFAATYLYAADGSLQRTSYQLSPGPDGIGGTADDPFLYSSCTYDGSGNRLTETTRDSGPDGILFTADDRIVAVTDYLTGF